MAMSRAQHLITHFVPSSWAAAMEAESRNWMVRCPSCGYEQSIWDMGGIRWKATGKKRLWLRCPSCGKRGWHELYRREAARDDDAARPRPADDAAEFR